MDIEPLPKVTFLPAQLTSLVIDGWTGDIIDYQKNGQICKVYHGQGTCQFKDGHEYRGDLKYGLLHGKGTFKWTDGTQYKGEFRENEITGNGEYRWSDGSFYKGEVLNGLRHGKGKYINQKEGVEYEGQWEAGMRHGYGELRYKNGSIYQGHWERGMKWGEGKMTYASGNFYEGNWSNNKRNGQGVMHWLTSNEKYTGNWEDNFQSGFGTHIWLDSNSDNKLLRNRYVGYWSKGLRHGKGTFYYSNGSKYEGDWSENFKHGTGVFTFEDGTEYAGPFEKDRMIDRKIQMPVIGSPKKMKDAQPESPKTRVSNLAKKEVEQNPFKKLIDISDLIDFETAPAEVEKECQNILLRHNSELKNWYRVYAKKIEATKSEESFSMTLRQVWRFLRDSQVMCAEATLAQFDRIYQQGKKNTFTLLGTGEASKFDYLYKNDGTKGAEKKVGASADDSDFSEEDESVMDLQTQLGIEPEDIHSSTKVVLQRQFFEAVVRAAMLRYSNDSELKTLAQKLEHLFRNKLVPLAGKNKAKTAEEDKNFKIGEKVFDEYETALRTVFKYFSKKSKSGSSASFGLQEDVTLDVSEVLNLFAKSKILDEKLLKTHELIEIIERYYAKGNRLCDKLQEDNFTTYLKRNPMLLQVNRDIDACKQRNAERQKRIDEFQKQKEAAEAAEGDEAQALSEQDFGEEEAEIDDETRRSREESETQELHEKWYKQVLSEHLINIKGVEIVFFEFKEIILELAVRFREEVDPKTGKLKVVLTKFIEDWLLRRLQSFVKFQIPTIKAQTDATRQWPESEKDVQIKKKLEEQGNAAKVLEKMQAEQARVAAELARMAEEDCPALDAKEVEELRRKAFEEEEAARRAREAMEENEEDEDESDDDEDAADDDDDDSQY